VIRAGVIAVLLGWGSSAAATSWRTIALPADAHGDESDVIDLAASHDALAIAVSGPTKTSVFTTVDGGYSWFEVGGELPRPPWGTGAAVPPGALEGLATRGGRVFVVVTVAAQRRLYSSGLIAQEWQPVKLGTSLEVDAVSASDDIIYAATPTALWTSPNGFDWMPLVELAGVTRLVAGEHGVIAMTADGHMRHVALDGALGPEVSGTHGCGAGEHAVMVDGGKVATSHDWRGWSPASDIGAWVNQGCVANAEVAVVPTEHGIWRTWWSHAAAAWTPVAGIDQPVRMIGIYYKWVAAFVQPPGAAPYIALTPLADLGD